jgi:phage terminase large subunit-like protein
LSSLSVPRPMLPSNHNLIPLYPKQVEFLNAPESFVGFAAGIGSGKSFILCYNRVRSVRPGGLYMVLAPTYPMLRDATLRSFLDVCNRVGAPVTFNRSENRLTFPRSGAEVLFRSADNPESLRGPNLAGVDIDEASIVPRGVYDVAIGRLRQGTEVGTLRAAFTPKGPSHWTHEVFATGRPNTRLVRARTDENPFLPEKFYATISSEYGDTNWARQELGGEFVQIAGAEFPGEWFARPDLWFDAWPDELVLKVISLDPSKGTDGKGKDWQAHVLIGAAIENGKYVYYVDADLDRLGVVQMCERTAELVRRFNGAPGSRPVDCVVAEENATMGLLEPALDAAMLRAKTIFPYVLRTNTDNKEFRIRWYCGPPLSRYQLRFRRSPGARLLVGQLQSFPHDEFDDGPDALAAGLRLIAEMLR